ncbi:BnaCnng54880D [Brassica napus]|uniref:BnaCnng54880D protein n=1 Tax=Brassica napus TaxID=3708 RepID=A0A078JKW9_BRANA|nr:BnaCnng54880D [Brassica napus]
MTRQTNLTLPAVSVADAPPEATQSPFQQTKTNEFIPPARFIVEDHPEAYNDRYEMESESENENEDEENQTYTTYPAGESFINPSPQHIPQQTNNTVTSPIIIGIQKNGYYDDGDLGWNCTFCQAYMWYGERIGKRRRSSNPVFTMCCKGDHSINNGRGPFVFRLSGENYHRIGDIVPEPGQAPKFSQLYVIDTLNEIKNRLDAYAGMRLIESRQSDGRTHNLPTANVEAALIPGDFVLNMETRDIVLESTSGKLQGISELHPAYLPLQYPLLFPYGEDGFRLNIPIGFEESTVRKRKNVTMREYFAFRILERRWEAPTITRSGMIVSSVPCGRLHNDRIE